jgi:hypothetical protein
MSKPIEFEKGKARIVVGSKEKLPAVIDALIRLPLWADSVEKVFFD